MGTGSELALPEAVSGTQILSSPALSSGGGTQGGQACPELLVTGGALSGTPVSPNTFPHSLSPPRPPYPPAKSGLS